MTSADPAPDGVTTAVATPAADGGRRLVLLVTSPRLPAGLLSAAAWDLVRAYPVLTGADGAQAAALRACGVPVSLVEPRPDVLLDALATHGTVVWLAGPAGDGQLARQLGLRLAREPGLAELELCYGSWDPPGARLLDAVAVLDRLLSPGGDPWLRELAAPPRTTRDAHESLARYLVEECYEACDAIGAGDLDALREELGDVLLQVVLHARLAEELPEEQRWNVDDVAGGLVEKLIRRNPHVFAGERVDGVADIEDNWERIKQQEKDRRGPLEGIPLAQPALSLAAKVLQRAERAGTAVPPPPATDLGTALLNLVAEARTTDQDPEQALRRATLAYARTLPTPTPPAPPS